jgi:YYY domain-containing protein
VSDALRWLLVADVVNVAFLPLTVRLLRSLPDRGYAPTKILGLLAITWVTWWTGTLFPIANNVVILWVLIGAGACSWVVLGRETLRTIREITRVIAVEEAIFVGAFAAWAIIRSLQPDISGTEKPMDLMLLQATGKASSFPPQDLWLSGHGVNYYYFGYLMMAVLGRLSGTPAVISYNLALAFVFAAAISGTYSIAYNLCRHLSWAGLGPVFTIILGNAHAFFVQILHGQLPWNEYLWYWPSSRVVANTITEFPMFSFILGDLHPHLLVLPLAFLAISCALEVALDERLAWRAFLVNHPVRLAAMGVVIGALFVTNSWDFPTYLCLLGIGLVLAAYRQDSMHSSELGAEAGRSATGDAIPPCAGREASAGPEEVSRAGSSERAVTAPDRFTAMTRYGWALRAAISVCLVAASAIVLFAPYYLTYRSPTGGIGRVYTPTAPSEFLQVFGAIGLVCVALLLVLAWEQGWLPRVVSATRRSSSEAGYSRPGKIDIALGGLLLVVVGVGVLGRLWVVLLVLTVAISAFLLATARSKPSKTDTFALALVGLAALVIALTETVYLHDAFGAAVYRMNTVFKFYFQAWILLGLAAAYGAFRVYRTVHTRSRTAWALWLLLLGWVAVVGGAYSVLGTISYYSANSGGPVAFQERGLNGMAFMKTADPQDYAAITWLQNHVSGAPVILEATGGEYSMFARVSTFAGLPTLLGWEGHELQWRGNIPLISLRQQLIDMIYSSGSASTAAGLLRSNNVSLVYVGPCERQVYGNSAGTSGVCGSALPVRSATNALTKFGSFMRVVYRGNGVVIYGKRL